MNIIIGRQRADELREKFTVLELETINHPDGMQLEAFCVIPGDKVSLGSMATLEQDVHLHEQLVISLKAGEQERCRSLIDGLRGKFGGEMDSFYDHLIATFDQ